MSCHKISLDCETGKISLDCETGMSLSCHYIPELFPVKYLGRQCVSLTLPPPPHPPHEVPHTLHPRRCDVYRLKLNVPRFQNRTDRLLLGGYLEEAFCVDTSRI